MNDYSKDIREALKFDQDKPPFELIDPLFLEEIAKVLKFGVKKYEAWNWAKGTYDWSRLYGAMQRHMNAFWGGEDLDPESGLPHLAHAGCMLMFLTRYAHDGWGKDNRFRFTEISDAIRQKEEQLSFKYGTMTYIPIRSGTPEDGGHHSRQKEEDIKPRPTPSNNARQYLGPAVDSA